MKAGCHLRGHWLMGVLRHYVRAVREHSINVLELTVPPKTNGGGGGAWGGDRVVTTYVPSTVDWELLRSTQGTVRNPQVPVSMRDLSSA